jgi:hypothetical protein
MDPVIGELRPQSGILNAMEKPEYHKFKLAIEELMAVEKECWDKNCPSEKIRNMTKNFRDVYGDDFPSLDDEDCLLNEQEIMDYSIRRNNILGATYTRKCITNVYDILKCPFILYENDFSRNITSDEMRNYCGVYNSSLLYLKSKDTCEPRDYKYILGINEEEKKISLDTLFDRNAQYPYNYPEFYTLLEEYNKNFAQKYNKTLTKDDFETEEEFQKKGKRNAEYTANKSLIQDLPIPPVDTYMIYGNYYVTDVGFVYDYSRKDKKSFERDEYLTSGGDGTVPNYSSFLTGMKWLYDKKMNNLTQDIKLIEYCSLVSKEGNKYAYNKNTFKNKTFVGLTCECINPDYKSYNNHDCTHSTIAKDSYLLDMVKNEFLSDDKNLDYNENIKKAIKSYNKSINYEQVCNEALYYFNRDDMDQIDWF